MNSCTIFFVACLVFACVAAVPAPQPASQQESAHPQAGAPVAANDGRVKRFFPIAAYASPISTVSGYSYLAPYANSGKIVQYPAPVVSSYAAVPAISSYATLPAISSYAPVPAISSYAAAPFAAYHAF